MASVRAATILMPGIAVDLFGKYSLCRPIKEFVIGLHLDIHAFMPQKYKCNLAPSISRRL
jgi:hypothetical protein